MKERTFNSLMPKQNEIWATKVLGMIVNPKKGPDLIDNKKAVEIKFKMLYSDGRYAHKCWRVLNHQLYYNKNYSEIYWGLGFYTVDKKVKNVQTKDLENLVNYRELYLVNWDWMHQFPKYHHNGKTKISEWDYYMRFPKFKLIPEIISQVDVRNGKIFFTEGVNPNRFKINQNPEKEKHYKDIPF